jgi:hypothetical protein
MIRPGAVEERWVSMREVQSNPLAALLFSVLLRLKLDGASVVLDNFESLDSEISYAGYFAEDNSA